MKLLATAIAVVLCAVLTVGHHTPEHQLNYPRFVQKKTHMYDVTINMTSGVPGLHPQVAKSLLQMELKIFAKTPRELILSLHKVEVSGSLPGVSSKTEDVPLKSDSTLSDRLKKPIKVIFENGMVKSYTLDPEETLVSAKIKKSILRTIQVYLDEKVVLPNSQPWSPINYNITRRTLQGNYSSHYVVTASPWSSFPAEQNVFNISRSDNYENIPYPAYRSYHNFAQQGCPQVCRKNNQGMENRLGSGCPTGYEPHHSPMKKSFVQHHNLRRLKSGENIIDMVATTETHVADLYDQDMEVTLWSLIKFKKMTPEIIQEPSGQQTYTDLDEMVNDPYMVVAEKCGFPEPRKAIEAAKTLLDQVSRLTGVVGDDQSKEVTEKLVLLHKALSVLKKADLKAIEQTLKRFDQVAGLSELDNVKRQIFYQYVPLIGTHEAVSYMVELIKESFQGSKKTISLWEAKSMLEDLPENILEPSAKTILELTQLLDLVQDRQSPSYGLYYSAAHIAVARVVRSLCAGTYYWQEQEMDNERNINRLQDMLKEHSAYSCPKVIVKKFIQDVTEKLKRTEDNAKRIIYIETLARTGMRQVLNVLKPYVYGQYLRNLTPKSIDFIRSTTLHALHNLVSQHPREVYNLVAPVFFNKTETPRTRMGAFSVFIRANPTLGDLQHVAEDSWTEPSVDVANFVTKTLDTFGNSSLPCQQQLSQRIQKVLPQVRRAVYGETHAKNVQRTFWDNIRNLGLQFRHEVIPSNESFYPSVLYGALGFNMDTLKEHFLQYAVNIQGMSSENAWDTVVRALGLKTAQNIPKDIEPEIFPEVNIIPRDNEFWRFVAYEKVFYSSSYYYFDEEQTRPEEIMGMLKEMMDSFFYRDSQGNYMCYLVKLYIPTTYRTRTWGHVLSYPVEFEMWRPMLAYLKIKAKPTSSNALGWSLDVHNSWYVSTLYTNKIFNLGDCQDIGVYHETRIMASHAPWKVKFLIENNKVHISYRFPEMPKKIFFYNSEAGTYAGKRSFEHLPYITERKTFKILPSLFVKEHALEFIVFPKFNIKVKTEDIQYGYKPVPKTNTEIIDRLIQHVLNAGWRRKNIEITRVQDNVLWTPDTEVKMQFYFNRDYVSPSHPSSESDWSRGLNFEDRMDHQDTATYAKEGQTLYETMTRTLSHIRDEVKVDVEHVIKGRTVNTAHLGVTYRHTLGGFLHLVHLNASAISPKLSHPLEMTADYGVAFVSRPNEFRYGEQTFGKQKGLALGAISFSKRSPFQEPYVIVKGLFKYDPLNQILSREMVPTPSNENFLPETHKECLQDVREGKSQSVPCIRAIREAAIYNKIKVHAVWEKELPFVVKSAAHQFDLALKNAFYEHMTSEKKMVENRNPRKSLKIEGIYIDKMTDTPVVDVVIDKPQEKLIFRRVDAGLLQPLSSIDSLFETYVKEYSNNTYPATCALMDNYVKTYDLKTFRMPEDVPSCKYILSTHCTDNKKFAVVAKIDGKRPGAQEIYIYIGKNTLVLVPGTRSEYKIKFNGKEQSVKLLRPIMFDDEYLIYGVANIANDGNMFVEVYAKKAGIKITYDGKNVKVQVHPRYKGELCGLCSSFNGEIEQEFRGPNKCLYSSSEDFAKSNIVGQCSSKTIVHPYICDDSTNTPNTFENEETDSQEEPSLKRNMVVPHEDSLCFSVRPVPACSPGMAPSETTSEEIEFHCLPKEDRNARKLVTESRRRILGELETKSVDLIRQMEMPVRC